jgi:dipeptidyl-peptidase-4
LAEPLLTAEDVARYPVPGSNAPAGVAFSADGQWVSFLWSPEGSLRRDLFVLDLSSGARRVVLGSGAGVTEENLSLEERLRRERARDLGQGVTSSAWARGAGARLLVPQQDGLHVLDAPDFVDWLAVPARVDGVPMLDPVLSHDGSSVAFVADDELYVASLVGGGVAAVPVQVTSGARGTGRSHGLAEFVAQEEMGRSHGFWWSPDGSRLAFTSVDETHIPVYRIVHQGSDAVGPGAEEDHRYPFAGGANAVVRLGIVDAGGGEVVWCSLGSDWEYLARVDWLSSDVLAVQVEDRAQSRLDLLSVEASTGASSLLLTEESDVWINLHDAFRPLSDDSFLWASERSGFRHLEVRSSVDGSLVRSLTSGSWMVERVVAASESTVWFIATEASPLERHLYSVPVAGGPVERVTVGAGTHAAVVDGARGRFVDTWSSMTQPPVVSVRSLSSPEVIEWSLLAEDELDKVGVALDAPARTTVVTADGETLDVLLYAPAGDGPFPTIVSVYGGPHVQYVVDAWSSTAAMRRQWLRSLGYLVVVADNRGSAGRGLAFEGAVRWDLGRLEVEDQACVVSSLVERGLVDPARVGINGWSYGGYLSALALAKRPDVFSAAVAGAPVTSWDGYDTHYTERYMGLPSANAEGYSRSSVMAWAGGFRGRPLMLVHGLIDENVHFRHTARLVNALIRERIPYSLLLFPDERHSPRSLADRVFMEERMAAFWEQSI